LFYYYGRKKQIAKHYPLPTHNTIVEPFAGSAAYSFHADNWKKNIVLIEKDERVANIWNWLINDATEADIQKLPDLKVGEKSSEFLHIVHAATKMAFKYKTIKVTPVLARNWEISRRVFSDNLHKVKHWKIICGDYTEAPNIVATWFIDPPYKGGAGLGYDHSSKNLDYEELSQWALNRQGQIICCEGNEGDYLPFEPLIDLKGVAGKSSKEKIYHIKTSADYIKDIYNEQTNFEFSESA
jgi:site-specific DNA-adenine methylase